MFSPKKKSSPPRPPATQSEFRFCAQTTAPKKRATKKTTKKAAKKATRKTTTKRAATKSTKRAPAKKTTKKTATKRATRKTTKAAPRKRAIRKSPTSSTRTTPSKNNNSRGSLAFTNPITSAHKRARQITNQRLNQRALKTSKHAVIAGQAGYAADVDHYDHSLSVPSRVWRWVLAILLIPLCVITTMALVQAVSATQVVGNEAFDFLRSKTFLFFILGFLSMSSSFWFCQKYSNDHPLIAKAESTLLYLYVLGHEYTHALFVYLSFGWVSKISVSTNGGYVVTNKSNLMIALSPYFVPFWSLISLVLMMGVNVIHPVPHFNTVMTILLGATWTFHFYWTIWMIPRDQPDLQENGTFFSLTIIYLANILLLSVLVAWASATITHNTFLNGYTKNGEAVLGSIHHWITNTLL